MSGTDLDVFTTAVMLCYGARARANPRQFHDVLLKPFMCDDGACVGVLVAVSVWECVQYLWRHGSL